MSRAGAQALLLLASLVTADPDSLLGAPEDYEGLTVAEIGFEPALQPLPDEELAALLPLRTGAPLHLDDLREAVVRLWDTGRYLDIAADVKAVEGGVAVRFLTRNTWFVGRVSVEGVPEPPNAGQLVNATGLQLGREFSENQAQTAIENILTVLRAHGFHEAKVERFLDYEPAFSQVNLVFLVESGPRADLAAPIVEGADPGDVIDLIKATRWERFWFLPGWKPALERRIQTGLERMRAYYQKRDYLLSSVTLEDTRYDPVDHTLTPVVRVRPGKQVLVRTTGQRVPAGRLRKLVPIYQEQSVDRDLLLEGSRNLSQYFQSKGFFRADVDFKIEELDDGRQAIDFVVDAGSRYKLVEIGFTGNRYFADSTLRERMATTPATRIRYRNGRISEALIDADLNAIRALYRSNGFRDVEVTPRFETRSEESREFAMFLDIREGPQWFISDLELLGLSDENKEMVRPLISSIPGQPYSEANVARDRDAILSYYYNSGHFNAAFAWEADEDPGAHRVRLRMTVQEGERRYVRASLISGLEDTRSSLVYSRVLLEPGDPLSQSQMVETQRRLYDLGIFARVEQAIQNPAGNESHKYLIHRFEEARRYSVNAGLGAQIGSLGSGGFTDLDNPAGTSGFSPRVSLGISRANMFGVGHTASLQTSLSEIRRRAVLNYLAPQFQGNANYSINVSGLYDFSRDVNTFDSERIEGSLQFGQRLSRANSLRYRFTYRRVDTSNIKLSDPELIPVFAQPVRVGLFAVDFIQDRRDDPLDSTQGFYNALETGVANGYLGSETKYLRLIGRNSSYHRVGRDLVLARSLAVGWLGNTAEDKLARPIPLPERIFSGGASSHRAFPENQAGPRDLETGFPLGGQALLIHNLELRFPLIGDTVGGVLFHDAGNVYSTFRDVSFRFGQRDNQDFDYMVHSFGFGIRYRTPIGPIRLDLAFSPNSPRFFGFEGSLEELIAGGGRKVDQRIRRFQFFFSIGQTF